MLEPRSRVTFPEPLSDNSFRLSLEGMQRSQNEFRDLCYLLTCKSIQDVPSCKDWEGVVSSRAKLVEQV
eukprot:SAG11_NODE_6957_length_1219_cov_2.455357_1_plen_68_part_10